MTRYRRPPGAGPGTNGHPVFRTRYRRVYLGQARYRRPPGDRARYRFLQAPGDETGYRGHLRLILQEATWRYGQTQKAERWEARYRSLPGDKTRTRRPPWTRYG
jgi:hypothetical protein